MNEEQRDMLYDLLTKKALHGLDEAEQRQLDELDPGWGKHELSSIEATAAAINMAGIETDEPLPQHLYSRIAAEAANYVGAGAHKAGTEASPWPPTTGREMFDETPRRSFFGWLGWAAAAAACIALAVNIWLTRSTAPDVAALRPTPVPSPRPLTPQEEFAAFERSTPDLIHATWAPGNVKDMKGVTGEVVWSDEKQLGYLRIRGLAVRTAPDHCYQLWIFDKVQDKATPIDGGTFDVNAEGEIIVPIKTRIKPEDPTMFALTIERHGGVVVSKREQIAAIAKVETQSS
jgi:hypothetical protein